MKQGSFIINGISSEELNSLIQFRPEIATPRRKVQRHSIPGVSEDYIFDEEAYENTPINLELFVKGESQLELNEIKNKISHTFIGGRYIDFTPYWDEEMIYRVEVVEPPTYLLSGSHPLTIAYTVGLSAKPFKFEQLKVDKESTTNVTLTNPYPYDNKPVITLYGTGNMDLIVNGNSYAFKDVDGHIVVDSRIESAYKLIANMPNSRNNRMYTMDFPLLKHGDNTISFTGNATKVKVETRWGTLVS